jgi:GNAT superfamily N-acetyltransferase
MGLVFRSRKRIPCGTAGAGTPAGLVVATAGSLLREPPGAADERSRRLSPSLTEMLPPESSIALLADHVTLVRQVGEMRWREWGYGETSLAEWIDVTSRENGREDLPVTLVALTASGRAVGAVGLGAADDSLTEEERRFRTPWLLGLVVHRDYRHQGIGRRLVAALENLTRERGFADIWVATGDDAVGFYQRCGWAVEEKLVLSKGGWTNHVLSQHVAP